MFKKTQNLKGLTLNLVLGIFKQCPRVQILFSFLNENLWIGLSCYGTNFKITNLDLF